MIDELVKFETAKLAKEKGFNEVCIDIFSDNGIAQYRYNLDIDNIKSMRQLKEDFETTNSELEQVAKDYKITPYIARPTQSLLQRWLREVHNLHIDIASYTKKDNITFCYDYQIIWPDINLEDIIKDEEDKYYDTYEIALEEGLLDALTLLP